MSAIGSVSSNIPNIQQSTAASAAPKPAAPPTSQKVDSDGDHDGSTSSSKAGGVNILA